MNRKISLLWALGQCLRAATERWRFLRALAKPVSLPVRSAQLVVHHPEYPVGETISWYLPKELPRGMR